MKITDFSIILILCSTLFICGCINNENKQETKPIVDFTYEPIEPWYKDIIYFNSTSHHPEWKITNWTWDLGDGTKLYKENITHQYDKNGVYTITLSIIYNIDNIEKIKKNIIVDSLPHLDRISLTIDDLPEGYIKFSEDFNRTFGINQTIKPFKAYGETFIYNYPINNTGYPLIISSFCRYNKSNDAEEVMIHSSKQMSNTFNELLDNKTIEKIENIGNQSIIRLYQGNLGENYEYQNASWSFIYFRIKNIIVFILLDEIPSSNIDYIDLIYNYSKTIENRINNVYEES
jgi:PKD repeat protein